MSLRAAALIPIGLALASPAAAQAVGRLDLADCPMARGSSVKATRVADLPQDVRDLLVSQTHGLADAGQAFNNTDVTSKDMLNARLIQAGRSGRNWYALYEQGADAPLIVGSMISIQSDTNGGKPMATVVINLEGDSADKVCKALDSLMAANIRTRRVN
jgi:hypothetical protein